MYKERALLISRIVILVDCAMVGTAFVLAYYTGRYFATSETVALERYIWITAVMPFVWLFLLNRFGFYRSLRLVRFRHIILRLLTATLLAGFVQSSILFIARAHFYSRWIFAWFIIFTFLLLVVEKCALKALLNYIRSAKKFMLKRIAFVGTQERARKILDAIDVHHEWGYEVAGLIKVGPGPENGAAAESPYRILGDFDVLPDILAREVIDEIIFAVPKEAIADIEQHILFCEERGIVVRLGLDMFNLRLSSSAVDQMGEVPVLTFYPRLFSMHALLVKRVMDIAGALLGLIVTALLFPFVALAIKLGSKGPVLFRQERVNFNGRTFTCYKFRSMSVDAEERRDKVTHLNTMNGPMFKTSHDPRVTGLGRWLRKLSIDELPQFWNVLKGEMSLVGPRPPMKEEFAKYENWHKRRLSIKPGMTGLWQIRGRSTINDFNEVVKIDLYYIDNWSLWLDIKILCLTVFEILKGKGAY